jgi:membrane-associated phospholipid phosphatase
MDGILQWGLQVVRQVQALGPAFKTPMQLFTFLGQEEFFLLLMPLLFWCVDRWVGANMAYLLILSSYFNGLFKTIFHLPRPYWLDKSLQLSAESTFGLPSGHAQNAVAVWGYVAFRLRRVWGWIAALVVIALISFSRLYLGVHFPTDVLGGWIIGAALLAAYAALQPRLSQWIVAQRLGMQLALAAAVPLAALGLYGLALAIFAPGAPAYDATLFSTAIEASQQSVFTAVGMLLGGGLGLVLERRYVRFTVDGPLWKRAVRYGAGLVGILALWAGLKAIFPAEPVALGLILRTVRYTMVILWTVWIWPWIFVRLGLAARTKE